MNQDVGHLPVESPISKLTEQLEELKERVWHLENLVRNMGGEPDWEDE